MITRILIALNVIGFLWEISVGGTSMFTGGGGDGMLRVLNDASLFPAAVLQNHQWWRIITGGFMHASLIHIGVNMFSLWILGRFIEMAVGSPRMLLIYVISLIVSGLAVVYFSAPLEPTVGASGAIFGLFGALFAIGFKLGPRGMDLIKSNIGILILNLIFTFSVRGISWQAHVGGLLAGFIITFLIFSPPKPVYATVVDHATGARIESEVQ